MKQMVTDIKGSGRRIGGKAKGNRFIQTDRYTKVKNVLTLGTFKQDARSGRGEWTDSDGTRTQIEYKEGVEL